LIIRFFKKSSPVSVFLEYWVIVYRVFTKKIATTTKCGNGRNKFLKSIYDNLKLIEFF